MRHDFERSLSQTEQFLRSQLGSRAAREASKRRVKRGIGEAVRRVRRSAWVVLGLMVALTAYSILVAPIGFLTWLVAIPTILLGALLLLFLPTRQGRRERGRASSAAPAARLDALADRTEDWLLERCGQLPPPAMPAVDFILGRLRELQPELARLPADAPVAGEAQRLIGQHLPNLVDTYLSLPPGERDPRGETGRRLGESLDIVAEELDRLSIEIGRERRLSFDTQQRFIESRYKEKGW
jgi:hypothetical protein